MATSSSTPIKVVVPADWTNDLKEHNASVNDEEFFKVGGRVATYKDKAKKKIERIGLQLIIEQPLNAFKPEDFKTPAHWAELIAPSVECESKNAFEALNTYDRANFSFGIIQFAAHTRNDNFHRFLRMALQRSPDAGARYLPQFRIHKNKVDLDLDDPIQGWIKLTDAKDPENKRLRRVLKPVETEINLIEVLFAARMIHWIRNDEELRKLMVELAIARAQDNMKRIGAALDGRGIAICALIFDIILQGRGAWTKKVPTTPNQKIRAALATNDPFAALQAIRSNAKYEIDRVKKASKKIEARFKGSALTYDRKTGTLK